MASTAWIATRSRTTCTTRCEDAANSLDLAARRAMLTPTCRGKRAGARTFLRGEHGACVIVRGGAPRASTRHVDMCIVVDYAGDVGRDGLCSLTSRALFGGAQLPDLPFYRHRYRNFRVAYPVVCSHVYNLVASRSLYINVGVFVCRTNSQLRTHFQGRGPSRTRRNLLTLVVKG